MSTIVVDLAALQQLRARCVALRDAFGHSDHSVRGAIDSIGPAKVTDSLGAFESHWNDGHAKVRHHLDGMLQRLDGSIKQYQIAEEHLRADIKESG